MDRYEVPENQSDQLPVLYLEYNVYGRDVSVAVKSSQYLWELNKEEETRTQLIGDSFFHPLAVVSLLPVVKIPQNLYKMKLSFSLPPEKYSVRYWPDSYAGNKEAETKYNKEMKMIRDSVVIPEEDKGFIVQVYGVWQQGEAYFSFYILKQKSYIINRPKDTDDDNE